MRYRLADDRRDGGVLKGSTMKTCCTACSFEALLVEPRRDVCAKCKWQIIPCRSYGNVLEVVMGCGQEMIGKRSSSRCWAGDAGNTLRHGRRSRDDRPNVLRKVENHLCNQPKLLRAVSLHRCKLHDHSTAVTKKTAVSQQRLVHPQMQP